MREAELEHRVLGIIDRVRARTHVEDSHVELKSQWPEPQDAARDIAAMCNAAGGGPVLFIVGVNEAAGPVPINPARELADWWPQAQKAFDRDSPQLLKSLNVHAGDHTVVALLFDSSRAPYVVKNPLFGQPGVKVSLEVPWRDGNRVRSARREDLTRILIPTAKSPDLELQSADAMYQPGANGTWTVNLTVGMYAIVRNPVTIIAHHSVVEMTPSHMGPIDLHFSRRVFEIDSIRMIHQTEVVLDSPGHIRFNLIAAAKFIGSHLPDQVGFSLCLGVLDALARPRVEGILWKRESKEESVHYVLPIMRT